MKLIQKFFLDYDDAPLLIVNASDINLEDESNDYNLLMDSIVSNPKGKNFINPTLDFLMSKKIIQLPRICKILTLKVLKNTKLCIESLLKNRKNFLRKWL